MPQPGSASSCGASWSTRSASSRSSASIDRVSSRTRRSSSRAIRTRVVCSARARRPANRSCQRRADQRPGWDLQLGPSIVQVPAQVVDQPGALADEAFAMIDEQPSIEFWARELRNGQLIKSFAQRRSSDLQQHRSDRTCRARELSGARRPSAAERPARRARHGPARSAPGHRRHAGNLRSPRRARLPGRAPRRSRSSKPCRFAAHGRAYASRRPGWSRLRGAVSISSRPPRGTRRTTRTREPGRGNAAHIAPAYGAGANRAGRNTRPLPWTADHATI